MNRDHTTKLEVVQWNCNNQAKTWRNVSKPIFYAGYQFMGANYMLDHRWKDLGKRNEIFCGV